MQQTQHFKHRLSQRGVTRKMVDFTLDYGRVDGDRWVLDRKNIDRMIEHLENELRVAKKIRDKGGTIVITEDNKFITTYIRESHH
ncbi:hypothetical protein GCM10007161_03810 [Ignatzschineria indica]|uniref:DUF4258 domain-containing protein n=1 Tax=Ignatzschineria indica TaxID=472583 RepID=A0A2U2AMD7_9GAMM|nr:hypothetical protein [Ignatzschineria indica]PWD84382.1 hypothetical protein DC082_02235 [Ignatzschineria indica]GGZ76025.1 hypothetical protein GCM10007161_03810 [Ignatzschineria indica]